MSIVKKAFTLGKSTIILLVFCASAFLMPKNAKATEIFLPEIQNSSFELLDPLGWEITATDIDAQNYGLNNQVFYEGESSYQLSQNTYTIKSADYIAVDTGAEYVLGVKAYFEQLNNTCKLSVEVFDQDGELLSIVDGENNSANIINAWQDVRLTFQTQQSACKIKVIIQIDATGGKVCIDNVYAHKNFMQIIDGASINLETNAKAIEYKGQLCFSGKIDKQIYDEILNVDPSATLGVMLVPTEHLSGVGEYTFKGFSCAGKEKSIKNEYITKWSNLYTIDEDGFYSFNFIIYNILAEKSKVDISIRAYIKYYENEQERYLFSNYDQSVNSRSLYSVAVLAKADEQTFNTYSEGQKEKINAYIEGREPILENLD